VFIKGVTMKRCKFCGAPLTGFSGMMGRIFFNVKPSNHDSEVCTKCLDKQINTDKTTQDLKGKTYKCQICERVIHEEHAIEHVKTEEYFIELIKKNHPSWQHKEPTCKECIAYYRKLVKDAEI
jgi:hypothetical protein